MGNILVINAGSSSVKLSVFKSENTKLIKIINARATKLFHQDAKICIYDETGKLLLENNLAALTAGTPTHKEAIDFFLGWLSQQVNINLEAVGHRVVHGGPDYSKPVMVTDAVKKDLYDYQPLAPLHQLNNLIPIEVIEKLYPSLKQVACFDTSFHQTMPDEAKRFALPDKYFQEGVRRYGFHGLSYEYIVDWLDDHEDIDYKKIIIAHLGNGASMCAVDNKKSIATTMSFTPLDGLVMGTRCGDLDPGVILHLMTHYDMSANQITDLLYKNSGLLGVSNETNNMRNLLESNNPDSKKAIDLFCYQANRHIGTLVAELNGIDKLIFTGGIGENSATIRKKVCQLAKWLGIELDGKANDRNDIRISKEDSQVEVSVISTNEALMIAKHTQRLCKNMQH